MAWYNEVKNMEENVTSYFSNNGRNISFELLSDLLILYKKANIKRENSFLPTLSLHVTKKQLNKHNDNCKDFEFKTRLVQFCINELNNDY